MNGAGAETRSGAGLLQGTGGKQGEHRGARGAERAGDGSAAFQPGAAAPARLLGRGCNTTGLPRDAPSLTASLGCDLDSPLALELCLCLGAAHAEQDEAPLASQRAPELEQPHNSAALRGWSEPSHLLGFA